MKYKFYFYGSAFTTARIRVGVGWGSVGTVPGYTPDLPWHQVTVKGEAQLEIAVPYLGTQDWTVVGYSSNSNQANDRPYLYVKCDTAAGSGDRTAGVYMHIWRSAGEDFCLSTLCSPGYEQNDTTRVYVQGQSQPYKDFRKPFENVKGVISSSELQTPRVGPETVEDVCSRWSNGHIKTSTSDTFYMQGYMGYSLAAGQDVARVMDPLNYVYSEPNSRPSLFDSMANLFLFNSGSILIKGTTYAASGSGIVNIQRDSHRVNYAPFFNGNINYPEVGVCALDPDTWKVFDLELPFIAEVPWDSWFPFYLYGTTSYYGDVVGYNTTTTSSTYFTNIVKKAGKNFQLSLLMPLPAKAVWPAWAAAWQDDGLQAETKSSKAREHSTSQKTRLHMAPKLLLFSARRSSFGTCLYGVFTCFC